MNREGHGGREGRQERGKSVPSVPHFFSSASFAVKFLFVPLMLAALPVRAERGRSFAVAIDADDVSALCQAPECAPSDFFERARVLGISAVTVRAKPLRILERNGDVLSVTRGEFAQWDAMGLLSPGAAIKPNTLWIKDAVIFSQVLAACGRSGLVVSTTSQGGYSVITPSPLWGEGWGEGLAVYDGSILKTLLSSGMEVVLIDRADGSWPTRAWLGGRTVSVKSISADAEPGRLLRAAWSSSRRLLVLRLPLSLGKEAAFESLRAGLRELKDRGPIPALGNAETASVSEFVSIVTGFGLWSVALFGALFSARFGLLTLKRLRCYVLGILPAASPVIQLGLGLLIAGACAILFGLIARMCLDARSEVGPSQAWLFFAVFSPLAFAALTLYPIDWKLWAQRLRAPLTPVKVAAAAAAVVALVFIFNPRAVSVSLGFSGLLSRLGASLPAALWWAPWFWREALIGFPCLLAALFLVDFRQGCPDCDAAGRGFFADPRTYFVPGLLGCVGLMTKAARGLLPLALLLRCAAVVVAFSSVLTAAGIALFLFRARQAEHHKTPEVC